MSSIPFDLCLIRGFVFDMDGVLSDTVVPMNPNGDALRTLNIKDGYAIQYAAKQGFELAIISGGYSEAMIERARYLGIQNVYMRAKDKVARLNELMDKIGLLPSQLIYVGDDIPDIGVMGTVALGVAPADAVPEVKAIADYISPYRGGHGVVRDVIEQTLKAQNLWANGDGFGW